MGFWSRVLGGLDKAYDAKTDLEHAVLRDRRFDRAEALAATGERNEAVVTGIHRRFHGDSGTVTKVRLEYFGPEPGVGALQFGEALPAVVRLGSTVAIRSDGDRVALDHTAMGSPATSGAAQRSIGSPPAQGIDDKALDSRVLRAIRDWAADEATLISWSRVTALGMLTDNWDLHATRRDGSTVTVPRDNVPAYCRWFVAPGATLPIHVDPEDPSRARVNWPELAERMAAAGGRWQDAPPAGSIAADMLTTPSPTESAVSAAPDAPLDLAPAPSSAEAVEGVTIEQWALVEADLVRSRVRPADHDTWATDHHGIPDGRWSAIKQQWESRQMADWRVGAAFGEAYDAARKELKKRRR